MEAPGANAIPVSSPATPYYRVLPVWFALLGTVALVAAIASNDWSMLAAVVAFSVGAFALWRFLRPLSEVGICGATLRARRGNIVVIVSRADVLGLSVHSVIAPQRICIRLRHVTPLGNEIILIPEGGMFPLVRTQGWARLEAWRKAS